MRELVENKDLKAEKLFFCHIPKSGGRYFKRLTTRHGFEILPLSVEFTGGKPEFGSGKRTVRSNPHGWFVDVSKIKNKKKADHLTTIFSAYQLVKQNHIKDNFLKHKDYTTCDITCSNIRNIFSLLTSVYFYDFGRFRRRTKINDFSIFIDRVCNGDPQLGFITKSSVFNLFDIEGNLCVDLLIRQEYLDVAIERLCSANDKTYEGDKSVQDYYSTKKLKSGYKEVYDKKLIKKVEDRFGEELSILGYDFDGPTDELDIFRLKNVSYNPVENRWDEKD